MINKATQEPCIPEALKALQSSLKHTQMGIGIYEVTHSDSLCAQGFKLDRSQADPVLSSLRKFGNPFKLLDCDQRYVRLSGYSKVTLQNQSNLLSLVESFYLSSKELDTYERNVSLNRPLHGRFSWKRPDNKSNMIEYTNWPINLGGKLYIYSLHSEVTPLVFEHNPLQAELEEAKKANERLTRMTNHIAMICHDLISPAASIKQNIWHIKSFPESKDSSIGVIETNADYIIGLTRATIDYKQLISGQLTLQPDWLPLPHFGYYLDSLVAHQVQEKGLKWKLELPPGLVELWIDPLQFARILSNLVGNAIKFTEKGQIKLSCKLTGGLPHSKGVKLRISDTGIGIPLQDRENVLQPYTSLARSTTGEKSYGLGLATVRELVDLMEGTLKITSAPSKGTTVTVNIPHVPYIDHHCPG